MTKNEIVLPTGNDKISFNEIPLLIAKAITPAELANTVKIINIQKKYVPTDIDFDEEMISEAVPQQNLTDDDWQLIDLACGFADLPPLRQGNTLLDIRLSDWDAYEKAIKELKPEWLLLPYSSTTLNMVINQHRIYLEDAAKKNNVVFYDYLTHIPLKQPINAFALQNAYMTVSDFKEYVKNFNLTVLMNNPDEADNAIKRIPVQQQQETAILSWLTNHGFNPKALPKPPNGKAGVKKACRDVICKNLSLFASISVFDTAWDRLRKNKDIQDEI